jgi:serine/threonine protein kinase
VRWLAHGAGGEDFCNQREAAPDSTSVGRTSDEPPPIRRRFAAATDRQVAAGAERRVGSILAGRFRIARVLGAGPHGTVYQAVDLESDQIVAVKVLEPGIGDFVRPVRRGAIVHPNVVAIERVAQLDDDCVCLRMEMVPGADLASVLADAPIAPGPALRILRQALEGVGAIHDAGLVHGDLKPENVMIGVVDADLPELHASVRILDVGFSHMRLAGPSPILPYSAPEVRRTGVAIARSDLFAMGVILIEMLAGEPVSPSSTVDERWPTPLAFLIWKALQPEPRDRYRDAIEMISGVDAALRSVER